MTLRELNSKITLLSEVDDAFMDLPIKANLSSATGQYIAQTVVRDVKIVDNEIVLIGGNFA